MQTVGHRQFDKLVGFTACLTALQTLSVREYYLYRKAITRTAEDQPLVTNLLPAEESVTQWVDERDTFDIVYLDCAKACDSVNYRLLLTKLSH